MNASESSLQIQPEFSQWTSQKWVPKVQKPTGAYVAEEEIAAVSSLDNLLLGFDMPVLVPRLLSELGKVVKIPEQGISRGEYGFDFIHPGAKLHTRMLDNPLTIANPGGCPTSIGQAFETIDKVWGDGNYAPLDWSSFAMLINDQDCGEAFRNDIVKRFNKFKKVTILFADKLTVGAGSKRLFIVWELILDKGKIKSMSFGVCEYHQTYYMSLKDPETILAACVEQKDVIMKLEQEDETPCRAVPLNGSAVPASLVGQIITASRLPTLKDMVRNPNWRQEFGLPQG
jgi:hypothetical protein